MEVPLIRSNMDKRMNPKGEEEELAGWQQRGISSSNSGQRGRGEGGSRSSSTPLSRTRNTSTGQPPTGTSHGREIGLYTPYSDNGSRDLATARGGAGGGVRRRVCHAGCHGMGLGWAGPASHTSTLASCSCPAALANRQAHCGIISRAPCVPCVFLGRLLRQVGISTTLGSRCCKLCPRLGPQPQYRPRKGGNHSRLPVSAQAWCLVLYGPVSSFVYTSSSICVLCGLAHSITCDVVTLF